MDWAVITQTLRHFETLNADDVLSELGRLKTNDPALFEQIESIRSNGELARSFMQTRMPGANAVPESSLKPGDQIDIWQIVELLGAGGMGEVYEAIRADGLFEQRVALKLVRAEGDDLEQRFEAERNRLAQLEHPSIARIVDGGTSDTGRPYMTMEFVDGSPITDHVKSAGVSQSGRLGLILQLCSAVAHAHGRLVLHRDIKHDNVLINADGKVRLIDFGVASLLDDKPEENRKGPLTLAYAAPEQLHGKPVTAATDTFAIAMLIHLLETGALPERKSEGGVAVNGSALNDPDLAAILTKALADDPTERYNSAAMLSDDLENFLGGFPVAARPISSFERFTKLAKRNALASTMSAATIVAVIAGLIGITVFAIEADEARAEAELRAEAAEFFLTETNLGAQVSSSGERLAQKYLIEDQEIDEADYRRFLIDVARETETTFADSPESASAQIYFVARYLNIRGDYSQSSELANFLIEQEQTPEITLQNARLLQARNLNELGDPEAGEQASRDVLEWMGSKPFLFETQGYAGIATNLALSTREPADLEHAIEAQSVHAFNPEVDASTRAYHFNSLAVLNNSLQDFDKTVEYAIRAVELSREAENINPTSINTRALNAVGFILQHTQDVALAKRYWPSEEDVMNPERGNLRHRSLHRLWEAYVFEIEGDPDAAYAKAQEAFDLAAEQYPPGSSYYLTTACTLIEAGALAGRPAEVRSLLDIVLTPLESEGGEPPARGLIAQGFMLFADGERDAAIEQFRAIDPDRVAMSLELTYRYGRLKQVLGID